MQAIERPSRFKGFLITFAVNPATGAISGGAGSNENNETAIQLMYGYDPGTGMDYSPVKVVNVNQP